MNTLTIKIERGVKMPNERLSFTGQVRAALTTMEAGDSFVVPKTATPIVYVAARKSKVAIAMRKTEKNTYRVWRTK